MTSRLFCKNAFFAASVLLSVLVLFGAGAPACAQSAPRRPRVIVIGVNGMEWDFIRPLIMRGEMPNLASVIQRGVYGKMKTLPAPNCPKVYSTIATSVPPEDNGITGFQVRGVTATTAMLKADPLWSILSRNKVTVGMANVPATFPAQAVNGYVVTGMLTRGKGCEDGILCSTKLSEVTGGDAVYPRSMASELLANVGDFWLDCSRMPSATELKGREAQVTDAWLQQVAIVRARQADLFDYLLSHHPTDFTMLVQSCEDRVGHWLYPIQPHNMGYDPAIHSTHVTAFPDQYRAFDLVLGRLLRYVDANTYLFIISDHGIKPLREFEDFQRTRLSGHDHGTTPIIAKHDFEDGDDVPGSFIVAGPGIKRGERLMGLEVSVFDFAPTVLRLYGIPVPPTMKGRVLTELFESSSSFAAASAK